MARAADNTFLLRPLPYSHPERLVALFERNVIGDEQKVSLSPGGFLDWQKAATTLESMSAFTTGIATVGNGETTERVFICGCSGNLFETLGVTPVLGRAFRAQEDQFCIAPERHVQHEQRESPETVRAGVFCGKR